MRYRATLRVISRPPQPVWLKHTAPSRTMALPLSQPELARIVLLYAGAKTVGSCADACAGLRALAAELWRELEPAMRSLIAVKLLMARAPQLRALHLDLPSATAREVALCARYVQSAGTPLLSICLDARPMRRGKVSRLPGCLFAWRRWPVHG